MNLFHYFKSIFIFGFIMISIGCAPSLEEELEILALTEQLFSGSWQLTPQSSTALYQIPPGGTSPVANDTLTLVSGASFVGSGWIEKEIRIPQTPAFKAIAFLTYEIGRNAIKVPLRFVPGEELPPPATFDLKGDELTIQGGTNLSSLLSAPIQYVYSKIQLKPVPQIMSIGNNAMWGVIRKETRSQGGITPPSPLIVRLSFLKNISGQTVFDFAMMRTASESKYCYQQNYTMDQVLKKITLANSNPSTCGQSLSWQSSPADMYFEIPFGAYIYDIRNNKLTLRKDADPDDTTFVFDIGYFEVPI